MRSCDVDNIGDRVESCNTGGAGSCDNGSGYPASIEVSGDRVCERLGLHGPGSGVHRYHPEIVASKTRQQSRLLNRRMSFFCAIDDQRI